MSEKASRKVRFINPPNKLKLKVGTGGIDESVLDKSQNFINTVKLDFIPYAKEFLAEFSKHAKAAKNKNSDTEEAKNKIISPVMQLKANGGMFQYQMVSDVADIALQFLEALDEINDDAYDVLLAHENTIKIIIANDLKGDGGKEGYALVKELDQACKRYFSKHKKD